MIGDSRVKDVGVAHAAGSRGIRAEYGAPSAADEVLLTKLKPLPEPGEAPGKPATCHPAHDGAKSQHCCRWQHFVILV